MPEFDHIAGAAKHFIAGDWVAPATGGRIDVVAPATGKSIGEIAAGDAVDVDAAVSAAMRAFTLASCGGWKPADRQRALLALAAAIEEDAEAFARIEMADAGKPLTAARRVDVPQAVAALRYFAGWATKLAGETMELSAPGNWQAFTRREPVGVVGQIIPWNYPLLGVAAKIGPAIAAGCAVVLKPAELASLSALRLAELAGAAGIPAGIFNVVTGTGAAAGEALVRHPDVAKISFTGSTATGQAIVRNAAATMKRVTVELGGKSPVIVLADADLDAAAGAIAAGIFFNAGQTCSAGSRLLVHASVADALVARIVAIARGLRIGPVDDPATELGPLISHAQREKVACFVDDAVAGGAHCAVGGHAIAGAGFYYAPTLLTRIDPAAPAACEEIFGPVLSVMAFETTDLDEIAALANANEYGLAAYVWTERMAFALGLVERLRAGTVRVNAKGGNDFAMPAGGMKMSGYGRENGRAGIEAYTELKAVTLAC